MGYLKQSVTGATWMGLLRGSTRLGALIRIAILARLLTPAQFGVFGIASLMLALLEIFTTTGINVFLIQEEKRLSEYVDIAWIVSMFRGILIASLLVVAAPMISNFFSEPDSILLVKLIGVVALIRGFINPSRVRFVKDLEFKREFLFSGFIFLIDATVAVILTFLLKSSISLVWGLVAGAAVEVMFSLLFIKPRPKLAFDMSKLRKIINRGKWVTAGTIFDYLFKQGDDFVVGRMLNTSMLGIYQISYKISSLPITEITQVINRVTFPVYSKISSDKERLKKAFLKTITVVILSSGLMGFLIFFFPEQIVKIILGDKWLEAVPLIKLLAVFGVIRAITVSFNPLFLAIKKQEYVTAYNFVSMVTLFILIVPFIYKWQINGAALSAIIGSIVALPLVLLFLKRIMSYEKS